MGVEIVVMNMNPISKAAVKQTIERPLIIAEYFHHCRYTYWAIDKVRLNVQKEWYAYDRKKCNECTIYYYKRSGKLSVFRSISKGLKS